MNFLDHAAELASQVDPHLTAPNPRVGCVVVRDGEIVASGVHERFGGPHAEVNALQNLENLSDCEIYITLEPCDHFEGKKTPSCTELLLQKKPKKIIVGSLDPQFEGKNLEKLRDAGIEVILEKNEKCEELNPFFRTFVTQKRPYVTLKLAQSLDGKLTSPDGKYISNEVSRKRVHEMRARYSAVLTTTKTILADDPLLNCRLDSSPPSSPLPKGEVSDPQIIVLGKKSDIPTQARIFSISGRQIHFLDTHDLQSLLQVCCNKGIDSILTECGPTLATSLISQGLVDEIQLFVAPRVLGKDLGFVQPIDLSCFELKQQFDLAGDVWVRFQRNQEDVQ